MKMIKLKKNVIVWMAGILMAAGLFSACGKENTEETTPTPTVSEAQNADTGSGNGGNDADENAGGQTESDSSENPGASQENVEISIAALKGPTAIGMIQVIENAETGGTANGYTFTLAGTADEITADIIKGNIQIAAVPCNLASVLYNKTEGAIQVAAINTTCVLYIVETGESINTVEDLKGKTIYSTGKGTTPEYTLNYLLRAAGIDPETDVTIEYKSEAAEVAAILAESDDAVAMLPQPYVTVAMTQNEKLRIALDVAAEWERYADDGSSVVTGVVIVNKAFAKEHKAALDAFLAEYQTSTQYVTENVEAAAELVEKFDIVKAAVAKKAIPYCNIVFIEGEEMQTRIDGYLKALYEQDASSVGGTLPAGDFYYSR